MAIARFNNLCIDANDVAAAARFWAPVLGLEVVSRDGKTSLRGPAPTDTIWLCSVPERRTVKDRVHLDVLAHSVAEVEALGAHVIEEFERWTWLADPSGTDFCVFERDEVPAQRLKDVVVDSADPQRIATWWAEVLGGTVGSDPDNPWSWVDDVAGAPFESIDFVPVPEPKTVKNRVHWDVTADAVQPLLDRGATLLRARDQEIRWHVLADPEGNEFCVFTD